MPPTTVSSPQEVPLMATLATLFIVDDMREKHSKETELRKPRTIISAVMQPGNEISLLSVLLRPQRRRLVGFVGHVCGGGVNRRFARGCCPQVCAQAGSGWFMIRRSRRLDLAGNPAWLAAETGQQRARDRTQASCLCDKSSLRCYGVPPLVARKRVSLQEVWIDTRRKSPPGTASRTGQQTGCNCRCSFVIAIIS
jgi:hypothetical protein